MDQLRWSLDPSYIPRTTPTGSSMLRMSAPNHPSNLLLSCKIWEESFDAFTVTVYVLRPYIPPSSHRSLLVHFQSALLTHCSNERYYYPDEAGNARWRSDLVEEEPYWDVDTNFKHDNSPPSPLSLNLPDLSRTIEATRQDFEGIIGRKVGSQQGGLERLEL